MEPEESQQTHHQQALCEQHQANRHGPQATPLRRHTPTDRPARTHRHQHAQLHAHRPPRPRTGARRPTPTATHGTDQTEEPVWQAAQTVLNDRGARDCTSSAPPGDATRRQVQPDGADETIQADEPHRPANQDRANSSTAYGHRPASQAQPGHGRPR